jgi:cysteinyl-tRNA synthetase
LWTFRRRTPGPIEDAADPAAIERFNAAMENDFDVAGALGVLFDVVREGNRRLDAGEDAIALAAAYDEFVAILGLAEGASEEGDLNPEIALVAERFGVASGDIDDLLEVRDRARAERDWATSDAIRDDLAQSGIVVEDTADGSRWHRG